MPFQSRKEYKAFFDLFQYEGERSRPQKVRKWELMVETILRKQQDENEKLEHQIVDELER